MAAVTLSMADLERICTRRKSAVEYAGPCPFCGLADEDGFLFWLDRGNYWCRQCGAKGWASDAPGSSGSGAMSPQEYAAFMREVEERTRRRIAEERGRHRQAAEQIAEMWPVAALYHNSLTPERLSWWYAKGVNDETVARYKLGYCPSCPTCPGHESYTIPVSFKGRLLNIRHRLATPPEGGGKYRPEMAGLRPAVFNADVLLEPREYILLVEGEIKAMVLSQLGYPVVGIPGTGFKPQWARWFENQSVVYVTLDPGANGHGEHIAGILGKRAKVVKLPVKPDDFFVLHDGTVEEFYWMLKWARTGLNTAPGNRPAMRRRNR
jgi:hypothetical protein